MKHIPALDGLRAVSIMLVILAHTAPLGPARLELNETAARMGMALFFCLSGYLITTALLERPQVWPFLVKRVFRIVPALWLYLLLIVIFLGVNPQNALLNALFISNYAVAGLNDGPTGHLWSLCVEMQFYLAISLVVGLGGVRGVWLIPLAAIVVTGLRIDQAAAANINTHLRVDEILTGGCLALLLHHRRAGLQAWLAVPARAALLAAGFCALWIIASHPATAGLSAARAYATAAMVGVILLACPAPLVRPLSSRPAAYVARISYALYIYHPLMIYGAMNEGSSLMRYLVKRPVSWALTFAAAHLSTFYWEAPWQRFARERILRTPGRKSA